jgi:Vacuolar protein sorting-associated protein 62
VVSRVLLAAVVAAFVVVPAAGGAPAQAPGLGTLLARHIPILVLHPAERFAPTTVDGFLADADLQRLTPAGWENVPETLPVGGRDHRLDQRLCRAIEGVAAASCYASAEAAHGAAPVVYGAAFRSGRRIALQYWLWYPFNAYSPTVPAGELWQVHEGDWESVSVILDARGRPLLAGYSQHSEGQRREWARVQKQGQRPRVFVALGSHANYFTVGRHRFDPRVVEPVLISVIRQKGLEPVDRTGPGRVVRPRLVRVTATTPSWMAFAGAWGEDAYIRVPPSEPTRYGNGPPGPVFHEQWRRPVADVSGWPRG